MLPQAVRPVPSTVPAGARSALMVLLQSLWFDDGEGVRWQHFQAVSLYLVSTLC